MTTPGTVAMSLTIAATSLLLLTLLAFPSARADDVDGVIYRKPSPVAQFSLTDQDGVEFTRENLSGRRSLVLLGYTHCPDICPFTLANLAAVRSELGGMTDRAKLPQFVFLSVDPDRDVPILGDYMAYFDTAFVGITGEPAEIDKLVHSIDGFYKLQKKSDDDDAYEVTHNSSVAVISPDPFHGRDDQSAFRPESHSRLLASTDEQPANELKGHKTMFGQLPRLVPPLPFSCSSQA